MAIGLRFPVESSAREWDWDGLGFDCHPPEPEDAGREFMPSFEVTSDSVPSS